MSIFDAINSLSKLAENDDLGNAATAIGQAAAGIPVKLDRVIELLGSMDRRLVEISLGLDGLSDPIKRPAFGVKDVEAAMQGQWPPAPESFDVPIAGGSLTEEQAAGFASGNSISAFRGLKNE